MLPASSLEVNGQGYPADRFLKLLAAILDRAKSDAFLVRMKISATVSTSKSAFNPTRPRELLRILRRRPLPS